MAKLAATYGISADDLLKAASLDGKLPPTPEHEAAQRVVRLERRVNELHQVLGDLGDAVRNAIPRRVPIVAKVACSLALDAIEEETGELTFLQLLDVPADARAVVAYRDSMEGIGILEGDYLIIVRHEQHVISPGERAIAIIRWHGSVSCKEVYVHRHGRAVDVISHPPTGEEKKTVPSDDEEQPTILARVVAIYRKTVGKRR